MRIYRILRNKEPGNPGIFLDIVDLPQHPAGAGTERSVGLAQMHRPSETVPEILAAAAFISSLPHPAAVPEHLIAVLLIAADAGAGRYVSVGEDRRSGETGIAAEEIVPDKALVAS